MPTAQTITESPAASSCPRIVKVGVVIVLGLLIWWPLVFLALAFIIPAVVIAAAIAAVIAAIASPIWLLVRRVRAYHHAHQPMLSLRRLRR